MGDFVVLGEPLAIELANTVVATEDGVRDLLQSADDVTDWIRAHSAALPDAALGDPPAASALRRLRDAVRELLDAAMEQRAPASAALRRVNAASSAVPSRPVLEWREDGPPRAVEAHAGASAADAALAAVARSAVEILGGTHHSRLRRCEGRDCILLFVATNPRRRWCSPTVCGNRVRVARHYERHHRPGTT